MESIVATVPAPPGGLLDTMPAVAPINIRPVGVIIPPATPVSVAPEALMLEADHPNATATMLDKMCTDFKTSGIWLGHAALNDARRRCAQLFGGRARYWVLS